MQFKSKKKKDCVKEARRRAAKASKHPGEQPWKPGWGGGHAAEGCGQHEISVTCWGTAKIRKRKVKGDTVAVSLCVAPRVF